VFHAIWHIKKRLFGPGGVANTRDTTPESLRFSTWQKQKSVFFICASKRETLH
jgi:hypothetical protein